MFDWVGESRLKLSQGKKGIECLGCVTVRLLLELKRESTWHLAST